MGKYGKNKSYRSYNNDENWNGNWNGGGGRGNHSEFIAGAQFAERNGKMRRRHQNDSDSSPDRDRTRNKGGTTDGPSFVLGQNGQLILAGTGGTSAIAMTLLGSQTMMQPQAAAAPAAPQQQTYVMQIGPDGKQTFVATPMSVDGTASSLAGHVTIAPPPAAAAAPADASTGLTQEALEQGLPKLGKGLTTMFSEAMQKNREELVGKKAAAGPDPDLLGETILTLVKVYLKPLAPTAIADGTWSSLETELRASTKAALAAALKSMGQDAGGNIATVSKEALVGKITAHFKSLDTAAKAPS